MKQVYFDDLGSFDEYGMRLTRFQLAEPETKTYYVPVPFSDGELDLTEYLTGEPKYTMRPLTIEFYLKPDQVRNYPLQDKIRAAIHGKKIQIRISDDPDGYLTGRCSVSMALDGGIKRVMIEAVCEPYKMAVSPTVKKITIPASGQISVVFYTKRKRIQPTFSPNAPMSIWIVEPVTTETILTGVSRTFPSIYFTEGANPVTFNGPVGTIMTVTYQEGWL